MGHHTPTTSLELVPRALRVAAAGEPAVELVLLLPQIDVVGKQTALGTDPLSRGDGGGVGDGAAQVVRALAAVADQHTRLSVRRCQKSD